MNGTKALPSSANRISTKYLQKATQKELLLKKFEREKKQHTQMTKNRLKHRTRYTEKNQ